MNKLRALVDFNDQEGDVTEGQEFLVNDERAHVLISTGKAERCKNQEVGEDFHSEDGKQLGVPRPIE